jgi:hypothetical protein
VTEPAEPLSRRAVLHGILGVAALALAGCGSFPWLTGSAPTITLDDVVGQLLDHLDPDGPYRDPTPAERDRAVAAADLLASGDTTAAVEAFAPLEMSVSTGTDSATGRRYAMAASRFDTDRSWGILAVDLPQEPPHVLVEVPHPGSDLHTERLGLALFRALPGAALLIAGAHRRAGDGAADVAHEPDSLFHALATHLADRGATQVQLHGFHDDSLADHDIVVSAGAGTSTQLTEPMAEALSAAGFDVCRAWSQRCGSLEGRTNAQGREAAVLGHPFLHLEINRSTRDDDQRSAALIRTVATVLHPA